MVFYTPPANSLSSPDQTGTLAPLEGVIHRGLTAISISAFLSIWSTVLLFGYICWRLASCKERGQQNHVNQYVAVLLNLVFADLLQAIGFSLSLHWLRLDSITADTAACRAQGFFINAGDVGAAFFTLAMAVLLFCDIVLERRIKRYPYFLAIIGGIWILDFFLASIGIAVYGEEFYRRAGMWCWINERYMSERLALHYIWVLVTEFGTAVLYTVMFVILWRRVREMMWEGDDVHIRRRAQSAAWSVVAYPIVYMVCTLPAVIARLSIMNGQKVGYVELSIVGFMLVTNGWLDVILYSTTRRSLITGQTLQDRSVHALDTFAMCRGEDVGSVAEKHNEIVHTEELRPEASPSNSWEKDTIGRGNVNESKARDFTVELDAIWRPQMNGSDVRAQSLNWETLERVSSHHERRLRQTASTIGVAR